MPQSKHRVCQWGINNQAAALPAVLETSGGPATQLPPSVQKGWGEKGVACAAINPFKGRETAGRRQPREAAPCTVFHLEKRQEVLTLLFAPQGFTRRLQNRSSWHQGLTPQLGSVWNLARKVSPPHHKMSFRPAPLTWANDCRLAGIAHELFGMLNLLGSNNNNPLWLFFLLGKWQTVFR